MHIAVTGGTGFLGRYMVRYLVQQGHRLRCWYRPTSDRSGLDVEASAVEWVLGDLGDPAKAVELVRGVDAVVHAAVEWERRAGTRFSSHEAPLAVLERNWMGTIRLFDAAYQAGVPRFIFLSTCAVHEVILPDRPLDETHPLWPTSHYGAHKAALEKFVHSYGFGQGWPICALRPTGIYGVAHPASASRWYELIGQVLRGEPIASAKGGKEVHAIDVARAVDLLLRADSKAIAGQAFNCYDRYISEQEVARLAKEWTGSRSSIADLNRGPKNQIDTTKLRSLGMTFGGEGLLRETVARLLASHQGAQ